MSIFRAYTFTVFFFGITLVFLLKLKCKGLVTLFNKFIKFIYLNHFTISILTIFILALFPIFSVLGWYSSLILFQ